LCPMCRGRTAGAPSRRQCQSFQFVPGGEVRPQDAVYNSTRAVTYRLRREVFHMLTFNRQRLVFGLYLLVLIAVAELILDHFHLPGWPAFMAMIFFFVEHMDRTKAPHILVGGVFGIACILLAAPTIGALAPLVGVEFARLAFILGIVFAIVAFGEMVPLLFNNYAFMYLTVTALATQLPQRNPYLWMGVAGVGGALLIAGVVGIGKLMSLPAAARSGSSTT